MGNSKLLISAAAVVVLGFATPSFADSTSAGASVSGAQGDHSDTNVTSSNKTLVFAPSESTSISKSISNSKTVSTALDFSLSNTQSSERNGNVKLVADQQLSQSTSNGSQMNFNGKESNYSSGANSVSGSAFAAYSGILNQGWNTGISSGTQAATNIAAQGQTTFTTH